MRLFIQKYLILVVLILLPACAFSSQRLDAPNVDVGLHVNRIQSVSPRLGTFTADITIWFRWKDHSLNPYETFRIKNAKVDYKKVSYESKLLDGVTNYAHIDIIATFSTLWDAKNFPFDKQVLKMEFEEDISETDQVRYRSDDVNMTVNPNLAIQGWRVADIKYDVVENNYNSNFGNTSHSRDKKFLTTQFNYELEIERSSRLIGLKILVSPIIAMLIFCFILRMPATESPRFFLASGAIFAIVTSHYLILGQIPDSEQISFAEKVVICGLVQSLIYLIVTILSWEAAKNGDIARSKNYDQQVLRLLIVFDLIIVAYGILTCL